jgi:hypothetical protein
VELADMTFWEHLKTGIIFVLVILCGFLFMSHRTTSLGQLIFGGIAMLGVWAVWKYWLQLNMMGKIYQVADEVLPDLLFRYGIHPLNKRGRQIVPFKGYYLIEYPMNVLTLIWDVEKGVIGHRYARLDHVLETFDPDKVDKPLPQQEMTGIANGKKIQGEAGEDAQD